VLVPLWCAWKGAAAVPGAGCSPVQQPRACMPGYSLVLFTEAASACI
jgi:hypothetical protein